MPEVVTNAKGKQRRIYRWYATPWEILRQTPDMARYLRRHDAGRVGTAGERGERHGSAGMQKPNKAVRIGEKSAKS